MAFGEQIPPLLEASFSGAAAPLKQGAAILRIAKPMKRQ
jgi:hypothetical protein